MPKYSDQIVLYYRLGTVDQTWTSASKTMFIIQVCLAMFLDINILVCKH
jgi:hypothetical protein